MRIFKNRGDIYFSKNNKEKSAEQRFLIAALALIVVFTFIFVVFVGVKNDFSAKEFFKPDNIETTHAFKDEQQLPSVSGKSNFISVVSEDENLLFVSLVQVDLDSVSYKVSNLKAQTVCDGKPLSDIFKDGGVQNVQNAVESLLDIKFDYYIHLEKAKYNEFFNEMGRVNYPVLSEIKFRDNESPVPYSARFKAGEQKLDGSQIINLTRYYLEEENNTEAANELMLVCLSQQINPENLKKSDELFSLFMELSETNITIRDFSVAGDGITVLSDERSGVKVYSAAAEYDADSLSSESLQKIKGYFVK